MASRARKRWHELALEGERLSGAMRRPKDQREAENFSALYRRGATELARSHAFSPDKRQTGYLEQVVATAHFAAYRRDRPRLLSLLRGWFFGVPELIRTHGRYHVLALAITLAATAIGWVSVASSPDTYYLFVDPYMAQGRDPWASREFLERSLQDSGREAGELVYFSAALFKNNTSVAFLCLGLGVVFGLPTIYFLAINGLMLGAILAVFFNAGLGAEILAWLLPHGVPEIGAIILCGGAGMLLGHRMVNPGERRRGAAVQSAAGDAVLTGVACVPLLLLAGFIEGVFRQSEATLAIRYGLFGALLLALFAWIFLARGRWRAQEWALLKMEGVTDDPVKIKRRGNEQR